MQMCLDSPFQFLTDHGFRFQVAKRKVIKHGTACPRSSDPFYIVSYIKWVTHSLTHSITDPYPYWKWYQTIYLYTHILPLNCLKIKVLGVQGLKFNLKKDLQQNLNVLIFIKNSFKNELHIPFYPILIPSNPYVICFTYYCL